MRRVFDEVAVTYAVYGLATKDAMAGVHHVREELSQRPWMIRHKAIWDRKKSRLLLKVAYDNVTAREAQDLAIDELRDLVVACFKFEETLTFELADTEFGNPLDSG